MCVCVCVCVLLTTAALPVRKLVCPHAHSPTRYSALKLVGTLLDVNVFRVSARDFLVLTEIKLRLPAFEAAVNASLHSGSPRPKTSVIINVMYDDDYTGYGVDPNGTIDASRTRAVTVTLDGFGMTGLFEAPV